MKKTLYLMLIVMLAFNATVFSQGCVAVRQMGGLNPLSSYGYTLPKGEFQVGAGYRYFHSFIKFI
jgi:hypothetical protein